MRGEKYGTLAKITAAVLAATALVGCSKETSAFDGGCAKFGVYAQNRWAPLGTAIREVPDVLSTKIGSFAPNEVIAADGWVDTGEPVYPTNPAPWNSGVWFHLANLDGWVSFAGVRGEPTSPDLTGFSEDGGKPAPTTPECQGTYKP